MKKASVLLAAAMFLALPMVVSAGIVGDCVDCHTMHNSEQGQAVAMKGTSTTASATPNQNLLRMDCIACHAQDFAGGSNIVAAPGGSLIPQVAHAASSNLAGGNFAALTDGGDRKGHNIVDFFAADADNAYKAPGDYGNKRHDFGTPVATSGAATSSTGFTCAGAVGCHGTRAQMISGVTNPNNTINLLVGNSDGSDGPDFWDVSKKRQGIAAITGAHHNNPADQLKEPAQNAAGVHDGATVAAGYRFIPGLKGKGAPIAAPWQNSTPASHNEYFGSATNPAIIGTSTSACNKCHIEGDPSAGGSGRMTYDSTLAVPNQSMSGFCTTCHGDFHSSGTGSDLIAGGNGTSGAFLRHPSDHIIPSTGEYAAYTEYDVTAPVARTNLSTAVADVVVPGTDLVMCLSCHVPHASEFDGMLRFDYGTMVGTTYTAGAMKAGDYATIADAQLAGGCMACHTTKGVLPENR